MGMGFPLKRRKRDPASSWTVFMFEQGVENGKHVEKLADAAFDLVLAC
jgi:hypothetical protein